MENMSNNESEGRLATITESGDTWHRSRYNLFAPIPGTDKFAGINLFHGSCDTYSNAELYLLSKVEFLHSDHPILEYFKKRGLIVNFDELEALKCMGRLSPAAPYSVCMSISPTMRCNFDCPYCFLKHWNSVMSKEVQDDVINLTERMLDTSNVKKLRVRWFGGEPLLAPDIIEEMSGRLIKLAEDRGAEYKAWMYSNGYLLTQDIADMLGRCKLSRMTITVDGLGDVHDKTRPLAGGGPTFDKIINNLSHLKLPFRVNIRQNLHNGNVHQVEELKELVKRIAAESGNDLTYVNVPVKMVHMVNQDGVKSISEEVHYNYYVDNHAMWFKPANSIYCDAGSIWSVGVNSEGRLFRCWEQQDNVKYSFGSAHDWNPADPIRTADRPDMFTALINNSAPTEKKECQDCVWLPTCMGSCPFTRLESGENCLPWKDKSDDFVLAVYKRWKNKKIKFIQDQERSEIIER